MAEDWVHLQLGMCLQIDVLWYISLSLNSFKIRKNGLLLIMVM